MEAGTLLVPLLATAALATALFAPPARRIRTRVRPATASRGIAAQNAASAAVPLTIDAESVTEADDAPEAVTRTFAEEVAALLPAPPEPERAMQSTLVERAIPITRLPLRSRTPIAWPEDAWPPLDRTDAAARHAFLRRAGECVDDCAPLLARAYAEEETEGRLLALQALLRRPHSVTAIATFEAAVRTGTDDERALAVEGLVASGARDGLLVALNDALDAIAAKAALGLVEGSRRDDFVRALEPHVDGRRLEAVLALLAGVLA